MAMKSNVIGVYLPKVPTKWVLVDGRTDGRNAERSYGLCPESP
jgi:hypothetical protein